MARQAWIQYAWASPVRLSSTDIYWYDDNGGTRRPTATTYAIEYSNDGTTWTPVTLTGGSTYAGGLATQRLQPLQLRTDRREAACGSGSSASWAAAQAPACCAGGPTARPSTRSASPVIIRTTTGVVPTLPAELDAVYASGARGKVGFTWQQITPAMVAETNVEPFVVYGTNSAYGLIAEAQVYVRPETSTGGISIQGAEQFEQTVDVGEQPYLPTKVEVSYNDGSRDNQAIGVDWDFDPNVVNTPGVYTIIGDLILPEYVSSSGTIATKFTLTVEGVEASIAGTVTDSADAPLSGVCVYLYTARNAPSASYATCTGADGKYYMSVGAAAGDYFVAVADPAGGHATTWLEAPVSITSAVKDADVVMGDLKDARVVGTVTDAGSSAPLGNVCVFAYDDGVSAAASYASCSQGDGKYGLYGMEAGSTTTWPSTTRRVSTTPSGGPARPGGAANQAGATAVALATGTSSATADAAMSGETKGVVTGKVTNGIGTPVAGVCVYLYTTPAGPAQYGTCSQADGTWYLAGVTPGAAYRVGFADPTGTFATQWWTGTPGGSPTYAGGAPIGPVVAGATTDHVDATMAP